MQTRHKFFDDFAMINAMGVAQGKTKQRPAMRNAGPLVGTRVFSYPAKKFDGSVRCQRPAESEALMAGCDGNKGSACAFFGFGKKL